MTNDIGIVIGRLSPPVAGRLQAFPWTTWRDEFTQARTCGFDTIEWVFEAHRHTENPIWTDSGVDAIVTMVAASGVRVDSICADYFMAHPLFRVPDAEREESVRVLGRLVTQAARAGIRTVLLPVLEASEIRTPGERKQFVDSLRPVLDRATSAGVRIGIESELPAREYLALVDEAAHDAVAVYYDVGNATAKGYDVVADVRLLGRRLCGVHLKDRRRGGPSVRFGEGDVNFPAFLEALATAGYAGPLVLQPASGDDFLGIATTQLRFVRGHLSELAARCR